MSPGGSCRRRRRRACRRSSAPSASRTPWRGSRSAARRRPGRPTRDSSTRRIVVDPSGPLRQNDGEVVLAEERVGAEPQPREVERLRHPPRGAGEERVGRGAVDDRVAVLRASAPSAGRRTRARRSRRSRTTTSGPSMPLTATELPASTSASADRAAHDLAPRVHAGVGAPRARERDSSRAAPARAPSRSSPATVRCSGCAAKPRNPVPSYATTSFRARGSLAVGSSQLGERKLGHTSSMRAIGALSPGRGPSFRMRM